MRTRFYRNTDTIELNTPILHEYSNLTLEHYAILKLQKHRSVTCQHRSENWHFFRHRSAKFSVFLEILFLVNFYNTDLQTLHRSDKIDIDQKSRKKKYTDL